MIISKFINGIIRFRVFITLALILGLIWAVWQVRNLTIDNSLDVWFLENDPVLLNYRQFQTQFGNDEVITIVFQDEHSILTTENLNLIRALETDIGELPRIKAVYTLENALIKEGLLSDDKRTTAIYVELEPIEDIDQARHQILGEVKAVLDRHFQPLNKEYHLAGIGVIYDALNQISLRDSNLFIGLSYVLILLVLAVVVRRVKYVLLAFFIILYSVFLVIALFCLAGKSMNMVAVVLPSLVMIFGVADVIHITNRYLGMAAKLPDLSKNELIVRTMNSITVPCFLTSFTTSIGFASLIGTRIQVIRDLGMFAGIGIMCAFFLSIIASTAGFSFFARPSVKMKQKRSTGFLSSLTELVLSRRNVILAGSLIVFLAFVVGIFRIRVDTYSIQFLRPNHRVRLDSDFIERNLGYYTPLEFTVRPKEGGFLSPRNLRNVLKLQKAIEGEPMVESVHSLADLLPDLAALESEEQVLEFIGRIPPEDLGRFVDADFGVLRVTGRVKMLSASGFKGVINPIMEKNRSAGSDLHVQPNGYLPLYVKMMDYITKTQINSFSLAFIIVFTILVIYARSTRLSIVSVVANLFPLGIALGTMGWIGIRLDIATVTITAIAIGVVVDDTMHFLHRFKEERKDHDAEEAVRRTMTDVGRPIISTSVILILGFAVLSLAQVNSIRYFGILSAIVIFSALIGDILILPSLILGIRRKD